MRASVSYIEKNGKKTWIVTAWRISVECSEVYVDGKAVDRPMELDFVVEIVPEEIVSHEYVFLTDADTYKAKATHIYTLPYMMTKYFAEEFGEEKEMALRVKVVGE